MKITTLAATAVAASAFSGFAYAAAPGATPTQDISTFSFTGNCTDCGADHNASAVLELSNYTPGTPFTSSNVVSFSYSSSKLSDGVGSPFVDNSTMGILGSAPGYYNTTISGKSTSSFPDTTTFMSDTSGNWSISVQGIDEDHGDNGAWSGADAVSAAPEPDAWALMVGGVAALGLAMRARRRRSGAAALA